MFIEGLISLGLLAISTCEILTNKNSRGNDQRDNIIFFVNDGIITHINKNGKKINNLNYINKRTQVYLNDDIEKICPITKENIELGEDVRILKCGHEYSKNNIDLWLQQNNTCPMCRIDVISK